MTDSAMCLPSFVSKGLLLLGSVVVTLTRHAAFLLNYARQTASAWCLATLPLGLTVHRSCMLQKVLIL